MSQKPTDMAELANMLDFVAEEMRSGRYEFKATPETTTLRQVFPSLDGDDGEVLGFSYTNTDGVITLFVQIES